MTASDHPLAPADRWHRTFKLLGDRTRLRLLVAMHHQGPGAMTVAELAEFAEVKVVTASAALTLMQEAGAVTAERDGRHVRYRLQDPDIHTVLHHIGAGHA